MLRAGLSVLLACICVSSLIAQDSVKVRARNTELLLMYDNDIYFFQDQYYTSGLEIGLSKLANPDKKLYQLLAKNENAKVISQFLYGHKIYTPSKIKEPALQNRDRPYAGWHYAQFKAKQIVSDKRASLYGLEFGAVGKISGIGNFQVWYHDITGITAPLGWESQIANEIVLNLKYVQVNTFEVFKSMDLISESGLQLGNGQSYLSQQITARFGRFNGLTDTEYIGSRLAEITKVHSTNNEEEGYLFYSIRAMYTPNNIFIEGSIFNESSPHTEEMNHFLIDRQWGYRYSNYYTSFALVIHHLSREVVGGKRHNYVSMSLAFRF